MSTTTTTVVVPSGPSTFAPALASALGAVVTSPPGSGRHELRAALAEHAGVTTLVHVSGDADAVTAASLDATSPSAWDTRGERVLRAALATLQVAHDVLAPAGGRVVVVTATTGISGAATVVPFVTAVEGVRAMAKSAARQWGAVGITINTVLVPLELLVPGTAQLTSFLSPPALGALPSVADVAAAITAFVDAHGTTGATVIVDGGSVMAP